MIVLFWFCKAVAQIIIARGFWLCLYCAYFSRYVTNPTIWVLHTTKTHIRLGAKWVAKGLSFVHVDSDDSDGWMDAQADLRLNWPQSPNHWICHTVDHLSIQYGYQDIRLYKFLFIVQPLIMLSFSYAICWCISYTICSHV